MPTITEDYSSTKSFEFQQYAPVAATMSQVYNASALAMDLTMSTSDNGFFTLRKAQSSSWGSSFSFEIDLELLTDPLTRKHIGIWLCGRRYGVYGYRFTHLDGQWIFDRFDGTGSTARSESGLTTPTFNLNERRLIRVDYSKGWFTCYVDGVLNGKFYDNTYTDISPGIHVYRGSARLHGYTLTYSNILWSSQPNNNYWSQTLTMNPLYYWPLGETAGLDVVGGMHLQNLWTHNNPTTRGITQYGGLASKNVYGSMGFRRGHLDLSTHICAECVFKLDVGGGADEAVFGMHQPITGYNDRYIILWQPSRTGFSAYKITSAGVVTQSAISTKNYSYLSNAPHHCVVQYDISRDVTEVYIDGVLDANLTLAGNAFTLTSTIDSYFYIGGYTYNGDTAGCGAVIGHVALYDRLLTVSEMQARLVNIGYALDVPKKIISPNLSFANNETREQAFPGQNKWSDVSTETLEYFNAKDFIIKPPVLSQLGYIQGKVTIDGNFTKGSKVSCLDERYNLIKETITNDNGYYKFESLNRNTKYIITAYDMKENGYDPLTFKVDSFIYPKTDDTLDFNFKEASMTGMLRIGDRLLVINGGKLCALPPQN